MNTSSTSVGQTLFFDHINGTTRWASPSEVWQLGLITPDTLRLHHLGAARGLRGRIIRVFFRLLERF